MTNYQRRAFGVIEAPSVEPVSLAQAKLHLRVEHDLEDDLIQRLITASRQHAESVTKRAFVKQKWRELYDAFPLGCFRLRIPPLISVSAIEYLDVDNVTWVTVDPSTYRVTSTEELAWVQPISAWPASPTGSVGSVRVDYYAGYTDGKTSEEAVAVSGDPANKVPGPFKQAILLIVGHLFEHREEVMVGPSLNVTTLPFGVDALLGTQPAMEF